jgi:hypothetical protein
MYQMCEEPTYTSMLYEYDSVPRNTIWYIGCLWWTFQRSIKRTFKVSDLQAGLIYEVRLQLNDPNDHFSRYYQSVQERRRDAIFSPPPDRRIPPTYIRVG